MPKRFTSQDPVLGTASVDDDGRLGFIPSVSLVSSTGVAPAQTADNTDGQAASGTANAQKVASRNYVFNGASWDRQRKPNVYSRVPSSAASGNPATAKASAGDVFGFWGQNGAAITYLQIYNKAANPVLGTDTPVMTYPIPANAAFSQMIPPGAYLGTGIAYAFTTDAAGGTGAAAAAVTAFTMLVA